MESDLDMPSRTGEDGRQEALRVFTEFFNLYQPLLTSIDAYLKDSMDRMSASYAQAYMPWQGAIQDMVQGVYFTVKKIPLPDTQSFLDSLRLFSFESAIQFLYDLCEICRIQLPRDWVARFQKHIHALLTAASILYNEQQQSRAR